MARIAGIDIPKNKRGVISLTYIFGVGKKKTIRPFFSVGNKEEDKIRQEFTKTYFKEMKI